MLSSSELSSIFTPRMDAKPGTNTSAVFSQLPPSVEELLDVTALRDAITEWDRTQAYPYPEHIPPSSFKEEDISGVPCGVYKHADGDASTPTVLLIHGGGFFCELANVHRSLMANIAARVPCHGVLPHYSLAPESKAPQAISEITSVLQALLTNPEKYGLTKNLIVIGYSSGGNLALNAVLNVLYSLDSQTLVSQISHLILMSPWVDLSMKTTKTSPYQEQQDSDKMLQTWGLEQMSNWYLPPDVEKENPIFSPVYRPAMEMRGMPPTTVIAGEVERLLGDAVKTAQLIKEAEVPTKLVVLKGQSHNHSAHAGLRDGVFTADIISSIIKNEPLENLRGDDGLGLIINNEDNTISLQPKL